MQNAGAWSSEQVCPPCRQTFCTWQGPTSSHSHSAPLPARTHARSLALSLSLSTRPPHFLQPDLYLLPPPPHPLASYKAILIIYPEDSVVDPVKQPFHNHLPSPPQKHTPPSWQVAKSALRGKGSHKDHQERRH